MEIIKGSKVNMSQIFTEGGKVVPVTAVLIDQEFVDRISDDWLGKSVVVSGLSKGRGFAGAMKRWGFKGGPATRGQSTFPRQTGSIGSQTPGRVRKGKRMAGHYGNKKVTVKGLKIVGLEKDQAKIMISGPIPGARNGKIKVGLV
ncbi:50S ribosomal protein L3 [Patescibacteria group bacterium]|nr:50S ribosomal protein L3 [Patescibacteria group bacterium]